MYLLMRKFHEQERLHMIWGNHDMVYRDPKYVEKHLSTYFDHKTGEDVDLFCNIKYHEAVVLKHTETGQELFLTHGHQADWWNYIFWKYSRFMVRVLWKPLNVMGIADPTSPAKNYKGLIKVERRTKKWITDNKTSSLLLDIHIDHVFLNLVILYFLMMVAVCTQEVSQVLKLKTLPFDLSNGKLLRQMMGR
ncbi:MAG: hypothetical protein ACJA1H_000704 [Glaciecola sp.]|jgi:hypothetical protein